MSVIVTKDKAVQKPAEKKQASNKAKETKKKEQ